MSQRLDSLALQRDSIRGNPVQIAYESRCQAVTRCVWWPHRIDAKGLRLPIGEDMNDFARCEVIDGKEPRQGPHPGTGANQSIEGTRIIYDNARAC